ncbi:MAG: CaiB/BaiF CoA transferase family protein, partial [Acidimicrobiales bacterium]
MKPLAGVNVLEIASWVAAPSACAILADMGADVIKVEPLGGDAMRGILRQAKQPDAEHKIDHAYHVDNRGKKSIAIDLDHPSGAALARRLAARADILVTNLLPARQKKFGLDPTTLLKLRPSLVIGVVSGYGNRGPDADRAGYDVTAFFGRGGVTDYATERDGVPPLAQPALGDHATGLALLGGILAALRNAEKTGQGDVVEVSLFGTAIWTMAMDISPALHDGRSPTKRLRHEMITPLHNRYRCGDGKWINVLMPETRWWPRFCNAVERPQWIDDPRFDSPKNRYTNIAAAVELIDEVLGAKTSAEWAEIFDEAGLIWGP